MWNACVRDTESFLSFDAVSLEDAIEQATAWYKSFDDDSIFVDFYEEGTTAMFTIDKTVITND
jgi:hypothetical protein